MINKAIFDAGIFIAFQSLNDSNREKATTIIKAFKDGEIKEAFVADSAVSESINFLLRKDCFERARLLFEFFLNTERIKIIYSDNEVLARIKYVFDKLLHLFLAL